MISYNLFHFTFFIALPVCSSQLALTGNLTESFQAVGDESSTVNGEIANCNAALSISIGGSESGTTIGDAALGSVPSCGEADSNGSGVWYTLEGNGETLLADTCDSNSGFDTVLSVFRGNCEDLECVGGNDDSCLTQSAVRWRSRDDETYFIFVQGYVFSTGDFVLSIEESPVPLNDDCENAQELSVNSIVFESTSSASIDEVNACGDASNAFSRGVYYRTIGTGNQFHVNTCDESTTFDTAISVYAGSCGDLACVDGNDDECGRQSAVTWITSPGVVYYVHVKGYVDEVGLFGLEFTERVPQHNFEIEIPAGIITTENIDSEVQVFLCQINLFLSVLAQGCGHDCVFLEAVESNYEYDGTKLDISFFIIAYTTDGSTNLTLDLDSMSLGTHFGTFFETGDFLDNYYESEASGIFGQGTLQQYSSRFTTMDKGMISSADCPNNPLPPDCGGEETEAEETETLGDEERGGEEETREEEIPGEVIGREETDSGLNDVVIGTTLGMNRIQSNILGLMVDRINRRNNET